MSIGIKQAAIFGVVALALLFAAASCKKDEDNPTGPDNNNNGPMRHITGTVRDTDGNPLANAALHVVYEMPAQAHTQAAYPINTPSIIIFENTEPLYTECGGNVPLPDGVMVRLFWDANGNGVDSTDEPPPLCDHPPLCEDGPARTVNIIEFPINGVELTMGPGFFSSNPGLVTALDMLVPNRYYARIYCADGNVLYTSNVIEAPSGLTDAYLTFNCTPCSGAPVIPEWSLTQSYPNPATDTITVPYTLRDTSAATLTIRLWVDPWMDTLSWGRHPSGGYSFDTVISEYPNGLYEIRLQAGTFIGSHTVLKNVTDMNVLRATDGLVYTGTDGAFAMDVAAGVMIDLRGAHGENNGTTTLARLKIAAIKPGYAIADTTFDATVSTEHTVELILPNL
jgi:hypothetical protein